MDTTATLLLTFVDALPETTDGTNVEQTSREVARDLKAMGYDVIPKSTGSRGVGLYELLLELSGNIRDNKEMIVALLGLATPIVTYLLDRTKKQDAKKDQEDSGAITIVIGNTRLPIRSTQELDVELLTQLLEKQSFNIEQHPKAVTIEVAVPPRLPEEL